MRLKKNGEIWGSGYKNLTCSIQLRQNGKKVFPRKLCFACWISSFTLFYLSENIDFLKSDLSCKHSW